ncbi:MAG: DNA primase [Lachnospiraceae bacterium]|nr:DNA primase [Lachnospiraceae bacterium]
MRYPDELIDEIRQRNDIVDVVGSFVSLKRQGSNYTGLCPFHSEKTPSFAVSPTKQMCHCFGCGAGGNVITFIMKYQNATFPEALKYLADRAGIELPEPEYSEEEKQRRSVRDELLNINLKAAGFFCYRLKDREGEVGLKYLKGRGLSDETIKQFGLGFAPLSRDNLFNYLKKQGFSTKAIRESGLVTFDEAKGFTDKFWNRVMFPIADERNRVIAFGGRVMSDAKPKYLNSPETAVFDKSRTIYGLNIARSTRRDFFILCEGYMDVISQHQAGFNNAIASLGTAFTSGHASIIKRFKKPVYLAYDSDGAGVNAALRAIKILRESDVVCRVINLRPYKDPDEFIKNEGAEAYEQRIKEAENGFLFEVRILYESKNMSDPDEKTAFIKGVCELLASMPDEVERESYMSAFTERYGIAAETVKRTVASIAAKNGGEYRPVDRPKPAPSRPKDPDESIKRIQRTLLTWMCEDTGIYRAVKDYISPSDFTDRIYFAVATRMFSDIEAGNLNPAALVNMFEEEADQAVVAEIFNTEMEPVESKQDKEKALGDMVYAIKRNSLDTLDKAEGGSVEDMMRSIEEHKKLEKLRSVKFTLK